MGGNVAGQEEEKRGSRSKKATSRRLGEWALVYERWTLSFYQHAGLILIGYYALRLASHT